MSLAQDEWRWRRATAAAEELVGPSQVVDFGVRIHVVKQDLEHGEAIIRGKAPVVSLAHHDFFGRFDTLTRRWIGPSEAPRIWYCTEEALPVIVHDDDIADCQLVFGAMGAGKTLGYGRYWAIFRALAFTAYAPGEIGVTAPTDARLEEIVNGMKAAMRPSWYSYNEKRACFELRNGIRIRCVGTARRSKAQGSRIQNWNWLAAASEELQDSAEDNSNVDARGRAAPNGRYKRWAGATVKHDPEWLELLDKLVTSGEWDVHRVKGFDNPWIPHEFWERLKRKLSKREYNAIVLAIASGPERALYPSWSREDNLRPVPRVGAEDVTADVLRRAGWGPNLHALVGHDPGKIFQVSEVLKAYRRRGDWRHAWWVVGEVTTDQGTDHHCLELLRVLRRMGCNELDRRGNPVTGGMRAIVRADPYGNVETNETPDRTVYTTFRAHGLIIKPAAYNEKGTGPGKVPKDAGIECVDKLLCNPAEERWLFVDCDDRRKPVAPKLVESFEMAERDLRGLAETEKKTKLDMSHWPAALRYAVWVLERPNFSRLREELAHYGE